MFVYRQNGYQYVINQSFEYTRIIVIHFRTHFEMVRYRLLNSNLKKCFKYENRNVLKHNLLLNVLRKQNTP